MNVVTPRSSAALARSPSSLADLASEASAMNVKGFMAHRVPMPADLKTNTMTFGPACLGPAVGGGAQRERSSFENSSSADHTPMPPPATLTNSSPLEPSSCHAS